MSARNYIWPCAILMLILAIGCSNAHSEQQKTTIAAVEGQSIYVDEFRSTYIDYLFKTGLKDETAARTRILNSLIDELLLVQSAEEAGITALAAFQAAQEKHTTKLLIEAFVGEVLFDSLTITEDELKDMFVRAQTTLTARHLYAHTAEQARELEDQLAAGATFHALAREVFADPVLANNGGFIGEFTLDDMDLAFEEAAYGLSVGEISAPVKTSTGYSIIKLESRFVKPLITDYEFAERRDRMMHFVSYRKKNAARLQYVNQLVEGLSPFYEASAVDYLIAQINGTAPALSEEVKNEQLSKRLVTYNVKGQQQSLDIGEFKVLAESTSDEQRASVTDRAGLIEFANGLLARQEIIRTAKSLHLDQSDKFKQALKKTNRAWIRDYIASSMLANPSVSEDSIATYYTQHREELIMPARVQVWEILVASISEANKLKQAAKTTPFTDLAKRFSLRPGADRAGGALGYLTEAQMGAMGSHILAARSGEIVGPFEMKGHYVLLKIGDREPARPMSFDEAYPEIVAQKKRTLGKENLRRHILDLRAKSEIYIDHALLAELPLKKDK